MASVVITDLCDLDTVIVGGPLWSRMERHAMPALEKHVAAHAVPGGAHSIAVLGSPLGPQVGAVGAGCLVLSQAFTPRPSDLSAATSDSPPERSLSLRDRTALTLISPFALILRDRRAATKPGTRQALEAREHPCVASPHWPSSQWLALAALTGCSDDS